MNSSRTRHFVLKVLFGVVIFAIAQMPTFAQATATASSTAVPVQPVPNPCARFAAGSVILQPPALFSQNGVLNVRFSYQQTTDSVGRTLFCFMTPNGLEEPTLHVNPGDTLNITVTNNTPSSPVEEPFNPPNCGDTSMTGSSVNIHYHGTNTSPQCHGDNVVKTLINSGTTFQYSVPFPANEPPGLYWYHPHVHGISEAALLGGGAGALVVDGVQNVQPAVSGLQQRFLVIRDQLTFAGLEGLPETSPVVDGGIPNHDLTVNFIPGNATTTPLTPEGVTTYTPSILHMENGEKQFWRICNCTSDTILDLQLRFDGVAQTFQIVSIDGVPVNSQDGTQPGKLIPETHYRMPPASRVEIIASAPSPRVGLAQLVTTFINTGPLGDEDPTRPLFTVQLGNTDDDASALDDNVGTFTSLNTSQQMFGGLSSLPVTTKRTLYFAELNDGSAFFMNVIGQPYPLNTVFNNNNPPAIVTTQGAVEVWTVQNQAGENHEFHQHQIHFQVLAQQNFEVNGSQQAPAITGQFADMIEVPFSVCGNASPPCNTPFTQVQLLMDFRGMDIGDFVFHCHILGHEDLGMMAIMQVNAATSSNVVDPKYRGGPIYAHTRPAQPAPAQPASTHSAGGSGGGGQK
jgi:FtsP/CotA-like multicopper oxidase with cupredoxin domain